MSTDDKERNKDVLKKSESRRVATIKQIDYLIDFLHDNEELRSGRVRSKEAIYIMRQLWDVCTEKLNKLGPSRNSKEWAKYWSDLKCRVKQKVVEINKRNSIAGEGSTTGLSLTYSEKRVVRLLEHDGQMKTTHEVPLDNSGSSSVESLNLASVKEEKEDDDIQEIDMNVEEFITTAPVVEDMATDKLPTQPSVSHSRPASVSLPGPQPVPTPLQPFTGEASQSALQVSPTNQGLPVDQPQFVPLGVTATPKRRRRRPRVLQSRPGRSCANPECTNCIELKEFADVMLKLEESHSKTIKLQTEASLRMTEVLKLQAEGILHTGVALREMATNLCRLLEGQNIFSSRPVMI